MDEKRSPYKWAGLWAFIIIVIGAIVFLGLQWGKSGEVNRKINNMFHQEQDEVMTVEPVIKRDTIKMPTVQEVLEARKLTKESQRKDSVFMAMPEAALIAVLMKIGTESTIEQIVQEYETNPDLYKNVIWGSEIQKNVIHKTDSAHLN